MFKGIDFLFVDMDQIQKAWDHHGCYKGAG